MPHGTFAPETKSGANFFAYITTTHTHIATLHKSGIKTLNYVLQHETEITRDQAEITREQAEII